MAKIVIDIDDKDYKMFVELMAGNLWCSSNYQNIIGKCLDAIKHGKVLPKGYGRIGDLDKFIKAMKERNDDNGGEPLNAVDRGYDLAFQHMVEEAKECVIIEADKER
jgi:hypothetical protein